MPRCEFWHSRTESIEWTFDRLPRIGEEVVLGDGGVFRVLAQRAPGMPSNAAFDCALVCEPTSAEILEMLRRGIHELPRI